MFGYVKVNNAELKVKENELYRSTYCGLCRTMGKCTGQCSRMTLNYDFVFLALVRLVLEGRESQVEFERRRCLVHPIKKRNMMKPNPALNYSAYAAALLNFHKLLDDIADEKGAKRFAARVLRPFFKGAAKKAHRKSFGELDEKIRSGLSALSECEKKQLPSVDTPAELFGNILGDIMSFGLEGSRARIAYSLGRSVGAWIYIADALDDLESDKKKGRYNPILLLYGGETPTDESLDWISVALKNHLYEATDALDLMEFESESVKNILVNILVLGMPAKIESIISGKDKSKHKSDQE